MSKITKAWVDAQIETELERHAHADSVRDLAALVTVRDYLANDKEHEKHHEHVYDRMRDYNTISIGEYADMRQSATEEIPTASHTTTVAAVPQHHRQMTQHRLNSAQHHADFLTLEDAQEWVRSMRAADGSRGGRWKSMADVKPLAERMGITGEKEMVEFFAVINAMYSDYCKVAKKHGVDKPEFYADLAKAWIHDEDAEENKAMLYYDCIVKKD